jgi:DNA-binding PadR family transcriptional regulator
MQKLEAAFKVLETMAVNQPLNLYRLEKLAGLSHATAHKALRKLLKDGFVVKVKAEKFRTGLETATYALTPQGLLFALQFCPSLWRQIDKVAENHKDAFLVFKKWHVWKREKCKDEIVASMQHQIEYLTKLKMAWLASWGRLPELDFVKINGAFLGLHLLGLEREKWEPKIDYTLIWKACKKDKELSRFVEELLKRDVKLCEDMARKARESMQVWTNL